MSNQVEVEVVLSGAEEAKKGLGEIGETAGKFAEKFNTENDKLGEGLSSLTDSVGGAIDSVKDLGSALQSGSTSMLGLLGPIGAVVAAGYALYETYQQISGAAAEAEQSQEAMSAAMSDLQSKLESLAEKGVIPTTEELSRFSVATIESQYAKERLEQAMQKGVTPAMKAYNESLRQVRETQDKLRQGTNLTKNEINGLVADLISFNKQVQENQKTLTTAVAQYRQEQNRELAGIKAAAKAEQELEEKSTEATLARIKQNRATFEALRLTDSQNKVNEQQAKTIESIYKEENDLFALKLEASKEDEKELKRLDEQTKKMLKAYNAETVVRERGIRERADIARAARDKQTQERAKAAQDRAKNDLAAEMKKQAELRTLRALELQQLKQSGASALVIAQKQYFQALKDAKNNNNLKLIAQKQYQLELTRIDKEASAQRQADEQARIEQEAQQRIHATQLAYDSLEFDINLRKDSLSKELSLLELKYARERELNATTQEEITELNRRESIERARITNKNLDTQIAKIGELSSQYGAGFAEAAYSALLFGDSFKEATGDILVALGRQAAIKALMETAEGTAALFLPGGQAVAAGHFKAAGLFAGAAAAAGIAGKALGGGSSGGGGGADSTPTGAPTTTTTTQREQAEQAPMVFNINFGGAVIYDTQRAAEQALADRITTLQNVNRRGAPRRR
jgi:myosin heavy subunit